MLKPVLDVTIPILAFLLMTVEAERRQPPHETVRASVSSTDASSAP